MTEQQRQADRRARVSMVRVLRSVKDDDGSFDLEFWERVGAEGRFAAAWEMVVETEAMRGESIPRLQRSAVRIRRPGEASTTPSSR